MPSDAAENPALAIEPLQLDGTTPEILTAEQARRLLESSQTTPGGTAPFFAIGLFAGIRSEEIRKSDWSAIDLDRSQITSGAKIAEKRRTRYVTVSDNLRAWPKPTAHRAGRLDYELQLLRAGHVASGRAHAVAQERDASQLCEVSFCPFQKRGADRGRTKALWGHAHAFCALPRSGDS